jgi:hypothetical protein
MTTEQKKKLLKAKIAVALHDELVAGAKLNPLCTFRAEGDWSLIQNSLSGVLDLYYAIALMSLPSKCRMS